MLQKTNDLNNHAAILLIFCKAIQVINSQLQTGKKLRHNKIRTRKKVIKRINILMPQQIRRIIHLSHRSTNRELIKMKVMYPSNPSHSCKPLRLRLTQSHLSRSLWRKMPKQSILISITPNHTRLNNSSNSLNNKEWTTISLHLVSWISNSKN
jgi:hypothetical protein